MKPARIFAAVRRRVAAASSALLGGGYEAARRGRRLGDWAPSSAHINTMLSWSGATLRDRTRDLVRNNPYVRGALDSFVANAVGCGIKPSSLVKDAPVKDAIRQAWTDWTDQADADALTDFYGLQALGLRAMIEAGEFFVRFRPRRAGDGLAVPLQLQLLEADMLPLDDNRALPSGNVVKCGIEFDPIARRAAYHFLRRHPGDLTDLRASLGRADTVRVPASEILHVYKPWRPGQIRGEPQLIAALVRLYLLDQYEDAELERKKIAAMFTTFVESPSPPEGDAEEGEDADGTPRKRLQPGTTHWLAPGETAKIPEAADVGPNFEAFIMRALLAACAGIGVPYANVTGDLRQANYSSLRAGTVEFRTRLEQLQHNTLVFQMGRPVWQRWMDAAALSGALDLPDYAARRAEYQRAMWISPKLPWVDPLKEVQAEREAVAAGFKSRGQVIQGMGEDPEAIDALIAEDRAREKRLGLDFGAAAGRGHNGGPPLEDDDKPAREDDEEREDNPATNDRRGAA